MHNRKLIAALTGVAALAAASTGWAQSTPTPTSPATSGAATTEDRATTSGQSASDTAATTDSGTGNTNTTTPTGTTSRTPPVSGTTTATDTTPAAAGTSPTPAGTSPGTAGTSSSSGSYGGTADTASGSTGRAAALGGTDATFLRKAMEGGLEEVQRAQTAMQNAQRAEVRNVASMMLEDHRRTNEKLTQLAQSKGWELPANVSSSAAESDQSRMAGGAGFDDNYLEEEIRHHRETISLFRAQTSAGSDPQLRQFAQETLPALEHHLEMLQGSYRAK